MESNIPAFLSVRRPAVSGIFGGGRVKTPFIEKGIHQIADVIKTGYVQGESAAQNNFFQRIDARIKLLFFLFFIVIVSLKKEILPEALIGAFTLIIMVAARLNLSMIYKRVLFLGFIFGFLIALPSAINIITPGKIVLPLFQLDGPYGFWIYRVPSEIGFTEEGLKGVMMLTLRVVNSLSLSFLILYTTPFPEIIKALKVLKVPDGFLMIVTLSYKYMFIFVRTAEEMHLAKKSRLIRQVSNAEARGWVAGRIAHLFKKTQMRCEDVFKAMLSRGFSDGNISISGVTRLQKGDWAMGLVFSLLGILFLWM